MRPASLVDGCVESGTDPSRPPVAGHDQVGLVGVDLGQESGLDVVRRLVEDPELEQG